MWSRNNMCPYLYTLNRRTNKCADNKKCTHKCGYIFLDKRPHIVYTNYRNKQTKVFIYGVFQHG